MTLVELKAKNAAIRAAREQKAKAEAEVEAPVEVFDEGKKEKSSAPKRRGKKPANREYLVVEDEEGKVEAESPVAEVAE